MKKTITNFIFLAFFLICLCHFINYLQGGEIIETGKVFEKFKVGIGKNIKYYLGIKLNSMYIMHKLPLHDWKCYYQIGDNLLIKRRGKDIISLKKED